MKIIIQLSQNSFIKRAFWTVTKQLAIISNPDINAACLWDIKNANELLPSIRIKFPEAKIIELK